MLLTLQIRDHFSPTKPLYSSLMYCVKASHFISVMLQDPPLKQHCFCCLVPTRDTPYSRSVIPLFSCPLSWSVHYNFSGDGSCRLIMEAVVPSWKLSRLLTVAMSKQDFSSRKRKCHFFIMVYKSLSTNVFTLFCLILNKICGRKSATWPWHTAASPNPIRGVH